MPKKLLLSIAAALAAFSLAACGADGDETASEETEQTQQGEQAQPEPELENIPDVVAVVNDREISGEAFAESYKAQFQQLAMQSQMTGEEPNQDELKSQALEMMINSELLTMEAEEQGFSSSEEDVDELLATMAEENGMEPDALMEEFETQGLNKDRVREDLHKEVLIQQVIEGLDVAEPSDDELQEMYDQQVEQLEAMNEQVEEDQAQEAPSFEEMEGQLTEQATMQKENEALSSLLEELREQADIETHL